MADRSVTVRLRVADDFSVSIDRYSQKMGQAEQSTKKVADASRSFTDRLKGLDGQLNAIMGGAVFGFGMSKVIGMAEGLYAAGQQAQRAGTLFESFGEQVGDTSALLERLRVTTRGVVDDTTLMQAASTQLSMGLARNADDVERLTDIGVTFAQAMGQDVKSSMENLNMLLANQSYLRLDTLGISSSQVRELAGQYRAAGMDSSEAFTAAFMDVAEQKLPQMSAVADATVTPFQRFQKNMDDWWADFGERFKQGVDGMIGLLGLLGEAIAGVGGGGNMPGMGAAQAAAGTYAQIFASSGTGAGSLSDGNISGAITAAILAQQSGMDMGSAGFMELLTRNAFGVGANDMLFNSDSGQMMLQQAAGVVTWFNQYTDMVNTAYQTAESAGESPAARAITARPGFAAADDRSAAFGGAAYMQFMFEAERQAQALQTLLGSSRMTGGLQIISPDAAREADNAAYAIEQIVGHLEGLNLPEHFLAPLQAAAEASRAGADAAAQWAQNLQSASLSQLFGQTGGGRLGEIDQAVLASLQAGGAPQETIDALARAMGLDTGQITQMSVQFEEEVVPLLEDVAGQMGADAYNAMRRRYDEAVANAAMTGAPTVDMASLMGGFAYYPGGGGPAGSYTVQPGDTAGAIAARFGVGVGDFGLSNPSLIMPGQQLTWGSAGGGGLINTDFDPLEQSMLQAGTVVATAVEDAATITDEMTTAVDTLAAGIEGVFAKTYQLPVELVVTGGGVLAAMIAAVVNGNGGVVPGSSPNSGRSNAGTRGSANDGSRTRGR